MKTETTRAGEFLVSEVDGLSREELTITGGPYVAGQVLGKITASGKYTAYDDGAADGTQAAAAVLYEGVDASLADVKKTCMARLCAVDESLLTGLDANGKADLESLLFVFR